MKQHLMPDVSESSTILSLAAAFVRSTKLRDGYHHVRVRSPQIRLLSAQRLNSVFSKLVKDL